MCSLALTWLTAAAHSQGSLSVTGSATPTAGAPPLQVAFKCTAVGAPPSSTYRWQFGDGATSAKRNASHRYEVIGNYTARVDVAAGTRRASWTQKVRVVLERDVTVGGEGGYANIMFSARRGQTIHIQMSGPAENAPYGHLEGPGREGYYPPNEGAHDGANACDLAMQGSGRFTLTVFDGSNRGGRIHVRIEEPER